VSPLEDRHDSIHRAVKVRVEGRIKAYRETARVIVSSPPTTNTVEERNQAIIKCRLKEYPVPHGPAR
jgi:hypothetical protein